MINVQIDDKENDIKFPCLMIYKDCTAPFIVLFTSPTEGTVIDINTSHGLGYHSGHWDITDFKRFNGTVTLEE